MIAVAFAISGLLAAAVACLFVAQTGLVQPRMGLQLVIIAFVGTVIGGLGSLPGAALGGFLVGVATILLQALLPPDLRVFREAFVFVAVAAGPALPAAGPDPGARPEGAHMTGARLALGGPPRGCRSLIVLIADRRRLHRGRRPVRADRRAAPHHAGPDQPRRGGRALRLRRQFRRAVLRQRRLHGDRRLCLRAAHHAGRREGRLPARPARLPRRTPNGRSLGGALAGGARGRAWSPLVAGFPLMRLSGISASIATFAMLVVTYVVLGNWTSVTGGQNSLMGLPLYVGLWTAAGWASRRDRRRLHLSGIALGPAAARLARGRGAAAASGVHIVRHRLIAFVISAFLSGIAGVLLGAFPRHGPGRDLLSRPHLPDHRHAGDRRHAQPDRRRRRRDRHHRC